MARLQQPSSGVISVVIGTAQNGKSRPHADVRVDVGPAVEWIEDDGILRGLRPVGQRDWVFVFLRRQDSKAVPHAEASNQNVVGEDIQFLLNFALDVGGVKFAQNMRQSSPPNLSLNLFAGQGD